MKVIPMMVTTYSLSKEDGGVVQTKREYINAAAVIHAEERRFPKGLYSMYKWEEPRELPKVVTHLHTTDITIFNVDGTPDDFYQRVMLHLMSNHGIVEKDD